MTLLPKNHTSYIEPLQSAVRLVSVNGWNSMLGNDLSKTSKVHKQDDFVYAPHLALIHVWCRELSLAIKVHFSTRSKFREFGLANFPAAEIDESDLFREYANMMGGYISSFLDRCGIESETSLPLIVNGFDEAFFSDQLSDQQYRDYWQVESGDIKFVVSTTLEVSDPIGMEKIDLSKLEEPASPIQLFETSA